MKIKNKMVGVIKMKVLGKKDIGQTASFRYASSYSTFIWQEDFKLYIFRGVLIYDILLVATKEFWKLQGYRMIPSGV